MPTQRARPQKTDHDSSSSSVQGYATSIGTTRFSERFAKTYSSDYFRELTDGISVSSIGMGTYLGDCDDAEDARYVTVLGAGIERGINLVDTAINYRCQRSERAVGRAIRAVLDRGLVQRDEIVVATKGGYIPLDGSPPSSRALYEEYLSSEYFERKVMTPGDVVSGGHSMTPAFLANQVRRSLDNLQLQTIDIYYLHNPEQQRGAIDALRFRSALSSAFTELEAQVARGTIRYYGCATWNGFRVDPSNPAHLSLQEIVGIAREAGGESHHLRVIQLPLNLAMSEAIRVSNQVLRDKTVPLVQAAAELGVAVIASASLMHAQLSRGLPAELADEFPSLFTDAQRAIAFVRSLPVSAALVGMRSVEHLEENLGAAGEFIAA